MDTINIRHGETVTLPLDAADETAVSADLYVGKPGQSYVLNKHITLTEGVGVFVLSALDTQIPLDTYSYQINVTAATGEIAKYPSPASSCNTCDSDLPLFIVHEALDLNEVS
jgi:hypothetical protein